MTCALKAEGSVIACPSSIEYVMNVTGREWQDFALAVTVKGEVTLAPSRGAATEILELNFAVTDGDGMEHPVIANARRTPVKMNNVDALMCSDAPLSCALVADRFNARALVHGRESGFREI
jgi:hypothetical protein